MADYLWFWLSKSLVEIGLALAVFALVLLAVLLTSVPGWIRRARCKHPRVRETMRCHAICTTCGKELGFIGTWREKQATKEKA